MATATWKKLEINEVLNGNGFYVSYLPNTERDVRLSALNRIGEVLGGLKTSRCETALVVPGDAVEFRILNGDFRKQYEAAWPSLTACLKVYEDNKSEHKSDWSSE